MREVRRTSRRRATAAACACASSYLHAEAHAQEGHAVLAGVADGVHLAGVGQR